MYVNGAGRWRPVRQPCPRRAGPRRRGPGLPGCGRRGVKRAARGLGTRAGGGRRGMEPARLGGAGAAGWSRGGTDGTKDTFLSTYICVFLGPAPRGGMVPRVRGGAPGGAGRRGMEPGRQAGAQKTPPAISGDGGLPFMLGGPFRPRFDFSAAVPVDYASRAVSRPGRMSLINNTLLKTLSKILLSI